MGALWAVLRRELSAYFATPLAYVFIVIFLVLCGGFTFAQGMGSFFERKQADLAGFFQFLPWVYLFLIPALSMRLWAEERRSGTIELLLTLPVPTWAAVLGKYLAAWLFTGIALALTFPLWVTVNQLGDPDNGAIAASYGGAALMAGAYLAIGSALSSATKNQVIAFVVTVVVCFLFTLAGFQPVQGFLSRVPESLAWLPGLIGDFGFLTHFSDFSLGVVNASAAVFFASLIGTLLAANVLIVDMNRG